MYKNEKIREKINKKTSKDYNIRKEINNCIKASLPPPKESKRKSIKQDPKFFSPFEHNTYDYFPTKPNHHIDKHSILTSSNLKGTASLLRKPMKSYIIPYNKKSILNNKTSIISHSKNKTLLEPMIRTDRPILNSGISTSNPFMTTDNKSSTMKINLNNKPMINSKITLSKSHHF